MTGTAVDVAAAARQFRCCRLVFDHVAHADVIRLHAITNKTLASIGDQQPGG